MSEHNRPDHNRHNVERAKVYVSLVKQMHTQYDNRRSLEWKTHLAVWSLLAASTYGAATLHLSTHTLPWYCSLLLGLALFFIVVLHLLWTIKIHAGQKKDLNLKQHYREMADNALDPSAPDLNTEAEGVQNMPEPLREKTEKYWLWLMADIGTTACLTLIVFVVAVKPVDPKPEADPVALVTADNVTLRAEISALENRYADLQRRLDETRELILQQSGPGRGDSNSRKK